MDQLLGCELAYVLRYEAGLDGEDRASLQYDARIMGIIAHEVISNVFKKGAAPSPSSARKTAESLIDDVIRDKAPQLYQRDKVRELTELKSIVLQDITAYASFLEANKLTIEASELDVKKSEKKLGSVHLVGKIDHVLNDENNNTIIMDHNSDRLNGKSAIWLRERVYNLLFTLL
jgi:ATP-dependent helicase/DNAse subunit B